MQQELQKTLKYWRASLADGALGQGRFKQRDRKNFIELSKDTLGNGVLPKNQVEKVFEGEKPDAKLISVRLWPMVTARMKSHGVTLSNGFPELVAPVVTEATVDRDGKIRPSRNVLARDLLTPLPNDEFSLGSIEDFDTFLSASPFSPDENSPIWSQYLLHCREMLDAVSPGWPANDDNYVSAGVGFIEVAGDAAAIIAQVINLYDGLISETPDTPLLEQLAVPSAAQRELSSQIEATFANRLGHANDEFPLADHQRQVLSYLSTGKDGDVLAVNGPPGTGKTTLAEYLISRLETDDNPYPDGVGLFSGRWLPDIASYGLYLPSRRKEAETARKYQTERFFVEIESHAYFERAKEAYLTSGQAAFPNLENANVESIVSHLHERIATEVSKLSNADKARAWVENSTARVANLLGNDPAVTSTQLEKTAHDSKAAYKRHKSWESRWTKHQADESILLSLFSFLSPVARKRMLQARVALEAIGCTMDFTGSSSVAFIGTSLQDACRSAKEAAVTARHAHEAARSALEDLEQAQKEWGRVTKDLGAPSVPVSELLTVDRFIDRHTRFQLFQMACHYWEGRWLLEMQRDGDEIVDSYLKTKNGKEKKGRKILEPRWRRRMMLTPCAVSTFASLPGKMQFKHGSSGGFKMGYFFNFIDLLIVDEAGQVTPEVAGPSFSFAKKALIIGDTQQIEPISSVSGAVDIGNLQHSGLLKDTYTDADVSGVSSSGIRSADGSVMRLAQQACTFEPYPELERGLYLFEHRRCYDEIINFCNTLCYKGMLQPKRGSATEERVVPAMGYLHIDGMALSYGGSRANATEAATIADWLAANRQDLERQYAKKLEDIVGVVTPFGRQVQEIKGACAALGISSKMTVGTVHSLQGAERPIIIFSPVYSKHADGQFIDMSPSMSPEGYALEFAAQPRPDLQISDQSLMTLRDAAEHDSFLVEALSSSARKFTIVSPWVIASTMKRAGLLDAFQKATNRGAEIDVFVDPLLNQSRNDDGTTQLDIAKAALTEVGVRIHEVRQLHSKIVIVDANQLCIGSYNWLSADRKGRYARHETSIAYTGSHLQGEIDVIKGSLGDREKR